MQLHFDRVGQGRDAHDAYRRPGLPVGRVALVVNDVDSLAPPVEAAIAADGLALAGIVPHDPGIAELELASRPMLDLPDDAPSVRAVEELVERELTGVPR